MQMNMSVSGITEGTKQALQSTIQFGSKSCSRVATFTVSTFESGKNVVASAWATVARVTKNIWAQVAPMIQRAQSFLRSPTGVASIGVITGYSLSLVGNRSNNNMIRVLAPMAGITLAFIGGAAAAQGNLIHLPHFILP